MRKPYCRMIPRPIADDFSIGAGAHFDISHIIVKGPRQTADGARTWQHLPGERMNPPLLNESPGILVAKERIGGIAIGNRGKTGR